MIHCATCNTKAWSKGLSERGHKRYQCQDSLCVKRNFYIDDKGVIFYYPNNSPKKLSFAKLALKQSKQTIKDKLLGSVYTSEYKIDKEKKEFFASPPADDLKELVKTMIERWEEADEQTDFAQLKERMSKMEESIRQLRDTKNTITHNKALSIEALLNQFDKRLSELEERLEQLCVSVCN